MKNHIYVIFVGLALSLTSQCSKIEYRYVQFKIVFDGCTIAAKC